MRGTPCPPRVFLSATTVVFLLVTAPACGRDDPGPRFVEERLKSLLEAARPNPSPDEVREVLARELRTAPVPAEKAQREGNPSPFPTRQTLTEFYAKRGHRLVWCDESGKLLERTTTLLDALRRAGEHGLDPADYALDRLRALRVTIEKGHLDEAGVSRLADFDLLVTASFFRYSSDLSTGAVHPDEVRSDWDTNPPDLDFEAALSQALERNDLGRLLEALPPPHGGYARLREALSALREVAAAGGWPSIPDGPSIGPGARGPRVALLRRRLAFESGNPPAGTDRFDPALAGSVRRFQERHGIEPDGKVAGRTLAELNVPVEERIEEVELNLERWRWIPRNLGDPHVLVNIPGFDLALVLGGEPSWRTRVVTGKAYTPTPVFSDRIVAILVNPPWNVPESIAAGEYLPELRKDPRVLERQHVRLLKGSGERVREVDPRTVDWTRVDEEHFPYRMRQDPGPDNALGRLKFELTNEFHIYLHDTPAGHLFGRSERDLSHGCVRVDRAVELASRIVGAPAQEQLREALDQAEERRLPVEPPVPIHILYWTAWVDEAGLRFGPDVYELEGTQRAALERARFARGTGGAP